MSWLVAALLAAAPTPLNQRLEEVSAGFLGTPYVISPLGEGWVMQELTALEKT